MFRISTISRSVAGAVAAASFIGLAQPAGAVENIVFVDPTATVFPAVNVNFGDLVYVAPFANILALKPITIGPESNVQDNVTLKAILGSITLGEKVILAHGAAVNGTFLPGGTRIGTRGTCPAAAAARGVPAPAVCPSFVGFNALVDGAIVEKDAMVTTLARVGPGITIKSGLKVQPGKNIAKLTDLAVKANKVVPVTDADRLFMQGVIEVNVAFAKAYPALAAQNPSNVRGINLDPGAIPDNTTQDAPTLAGVPTQDPKFRNRIIGDVRMANSRMELDAVMGNSISLRADEGSPFVIGTIADMDDRTVFHALEGSSIEAGGEGTYGFRSVMHGGATPFIAAAGEANATITGERFTLGPQSVFFRSRAGDGVTVGFKSLVQQSDLAAGTIVPDRTVIIGNAVFGKVEW